MPIARSLASLALLSLLAACAARPQLTAQVESGQYRSRAHRDYTPPGPPGDPWGPYVVEAAGKYDIPERWIREVMRQESGGRMYGRGGDLITSGAGAMGLMQVMPGTYDELRARYSELGDDPYDPHNNILAGTAYIREMYDIYGSPGFLAAYNAGPGRLDDYMTRNRPLPEETRRYVASIGPRLVGEPNRPSPGAQYAMNTLPISIPRGSRYAASQRYSAPVQVAQAAPLAAPYAVTPSAEPSAGNYIVLRPQPAWTPPAEAVAPTQVAQAAGPFITLRPQPAWTPPPMPVEVAEAPEPLPPTLAAPSRIVPAAPLPTPPAPGRAQFAALPEPPRPAALPIPLSQQQLAAAALVPVSPRGFGFISQAHAEPIHPHGGGMSGNWAVQVGAFASENLAASATASARDHARDVLAPARPSVSAVRQPHGTLYRARLNGLSRDAASQACERLVRARTTCMVVSPDAQS